MKYGTGLSLTAAEDLAPITDYVKSLDKAGFDFLTLGGRVMSMEPDPNLQRPASTYAGPFYDPFVLFGFWAGQTSHISFMSNILILPLYQTGVVAKQSAQLSDVSNGRFILGVGLSWNADEYEALGQDLHIRGRRSAEQMRLLKRLWSEPYVTFKGRYHNYNKVGLARPPKQPIPIWVGSTANERPLRRAARLADGWTPLGDPTPAIPLLKQYLEEYGRNPADFSIMARVNTSQGTPAEWQEQAGKFKEMGATYLQVSAPADLPLSEQVGKVTEAREELKKAVG